MNKITQINELCGGRCIVFISEVDETDGGDHKDEGRMKSENINSVYAEKYTFMFLIFFFLSSFHFFDHTMNLYTKYYTANVA